MKAWLLDELGGLDRLRVAEVGEPVVGAGEVLIEVEFAGLNPADRYLSQGEYPAKPPMPHVLGRDGVGIIKAVESGVKKFGVGQRVLILRGDTGVNRGGTFAQRVAVAEDSIARVPKGWSVEEAGGASLVYLTAYQALTVWGKLEPSVVLISGASGGVGVAGIHLAKAMGHTVVGLSRGEAKKKRLMEIGADHVLDASDAKWMGKLKEILSPRRIDLAIDNIGGEIFNQMIQTLGDHGKVSVVGRLAGAVPQFNTASLFFRRIKVGGVAVGAYTRDEAQGAWEAVVGLLAKRGVRPIVDRVFEFDRLREAFERLKEGPVGKVILRI